MRFKLMTKVTCGGCGQVWYMADDTHNGATLPSGKRAVGGHCPRCYMYRTTLIRPDSVYNAGAYKYRGETA